MPEDQAGVSSIYPVAISRDGLSYAYSYTGVAASALYVADGWGWVEREILPKIDSNFDRLRKNPKFPNSSRG